MLTEAYLTLDLQKGCPTGVVADIMIFKTIIGAHHVVQHPLGVSSMI